MSKKVVKIAWGIVIALCIIISFYPLTFVDGDTNKGLLSLKSPELLSSKFWQFAFYTHISFGGIALLVGWILFLEKFRNKNLQLHRKIGMFYIICILLSGISGYYIAYHATGTWVSKLGFAGMSTAWFITTFLAFYFIKNKNIEKHQNWMRRSYAVTFVGVSFRLWLPFLLFVMDLKFLEAYPINAWVSWIGNLLVVELFILFYFNRKTPVAIS